MGTAMAKRLLSQSVPVVLYNRSKEKLEALAAHELAHGAADLSEAFEANTILISLSDLEPLFHLFEANSTNFDGKHMILTSNVNVADVQRLDRLCVERNGTTSHFAYLSSHTDIK